MQAINERLVFPRIPRLDPNLDLNPSDGHVIGILGKLGPSTMTVLAQSLHLPLSTATHRIDKLVTRGLVGRNRSETDRRIVAVSLTPLGLQLHGHMQTFHQEVAAQILKPLSAAEQEQLIQLLTKINQS
jgi:MarR family transcriptional regulator, organic hydroperoxide resistance regulator